MCQHCDTYKYLEARPNNWRSQLWVKGRNMTVWHLIAAMRTERATLEGTAKNFESCRLGRAGTSNHPH